MPKATRQTPPRRLTASARESLSLHGALALDLINTEVIDRGKPRDLLASPEALARWWEDACKQHPDECAVEGARVPIAWTSELLDAIKTLRTTLRILITNVVERQAVEEGDLQPLNAVLALGSCALERTGRGGVRAVTHLRDPEWGSVLIPVARSAVRLFTESDWLRLHQCRSDRCVLFFYDVTRSATRRWCSPACMNRARSIQHYQLTKKHIENETAHL